MVIYAVWIKMFEGEWDYVRKTDENNWWNDGSPVKLFDTKESAEEEARKWNTGRVIEYSSTDKIYGIE